MPDYGDVDPTTGQTNSRTQWSGTVDPLAPSVSNGQITPEQWAEYQKKRHRDAILGILGTLGMTTGLGFAGQALGGAGAPASGAASAGAPIAGGSPWAVTPLATTATMGAPGAMAGGSGGLAGAAGKLLGGMGARDWASLAASGIGTVGGLMSNKPLSAPTSATTDPNMQKLIASMQGRLDQSEPLYKSIMAMANGLLPTQYQQKGGGGMP